MKRLILVLAACFTFSLLAGCAAPSRTSQSALALPPPPPGYGRVFIYRGGDIVGALLQPTVTMNNRIVGKAVPGQYIYINVPPGKYIVRTASDPSRSADFTIRPGSKAYVRLNNVFAGIQQVYPELVNEFTGLTDMNGLSYGG